MRLGQCHVACACAGAPGFRSWRVEGSLPLLSSVSKLMNIRLLSNGDCAPSTGPCAALHCGGICANCVERKLCCARRALSWRTPMRGKARIWISATAPSPTSVSIQGFAPSGSRRSEQRRALLRGFPHCLLLWGARSFGMDSVRHGACCESPAHFCSMRSVKC